MIRRTGPSAQATPVTRATPVPAAPPDIMAAARALTVDRGGRTVLADVDLELQAGEVLAVVGPNGAGKSTLLAALVGDLTPAAGQVELWERPVGDWSMRQRARLRAVLEQRAAVSFPFTVDQVVRMGRAPWHGTERADADDEAVVAALAATDVSALASRIFPSLSGGEQARVSLSRVLAQEAPVLFLDEPTAALDLRHQELVMGIAGRHARSGGAALVVVHDLSLAAAHADRVAVLDGGRLRAVDAPRQVLVPELLTEVYGCLVDVFDHPDTGQLVVMPRR